MRFANIRNLPGNHPGGPPGYKGNNKPILQAYCPKCGNSNVKHTAEECKGINRGKYAGPLTRRWALPPCTPPPSPA